MTKRIDKIDEDLSLGLYINGDTIEGKQRWQEDGVLWQKDKVWYTRKISKR